MAKKQGVSLPAGQGGLIGGVSTSLKTRFEFSPKLVVYAALFTVFLVGMLHYMKRNGLL